MTKKRNRRIGSKLDDFLKHEGILEELQVRAVKEVVAWRLWKLLVIGSYVDVLQIKP